MNLYCCMLFSVGIAVLSNGANIDYSIIHASELIQIRIIENETVVSIMEFHLDQPSKQACMSYFQEKNRPQILSILESAPFTTPSNNAVLHNLIGIFLFESKNENLSHAHFLQACDLSNYTIPEYVLNAALLDNKNTSKIALFQKGISLSKFPLR